MSTNSNNTSELFEPPINRHMQKLDRAFFRKTVPLSAATIYNVKDISHVRTLLQRSGDILQLHPVKPLRDDSGSPGAKCILLKPGVEAADRNTWSETVKTLAQDGLVQLRPYQLNLTYDDWNMQAILESILPELPDNEKETPAGFAQVGHVAHLNLREQYLPYKNLIGEVLLDKNPIIRTVINKTLDVGTESVFRTFPYEVLAGPDDLNVVVNESGCEFRFNFGNVYWNSRLGTEHARLIDKFQEGEAVCDVMAGVGPFSVPAGKRKVFVRANDLNPYSFEGLQKAIAGNHVGKFVSASCEDGREFIKGATGDLGTSSRQVEISSKKKISRNESPQQREILIAKARQEARILEEPSAFNHYVLNLPAIAVEFLDAFRGVYYTREYLFENRKLPLIHVYLFQSRHENDSEEYEEMSERISKHLGDDIKLGDPVSELEFYYVRLVAPKKKMYCASFRLPAAVAFSKP